jgi:hypothetical protein
MRGLPLLTSLVSIATTFAFVASAAFVGSEQLALSVCVSPFLLLREGAGGVPHHPVLPAAPSLVACMPPAPSNAIIGLQAVRDSATRSSSSAVTI